MSKECQFYASQEKDSKKRLTFIIAGGLSEGFNLIEKSGDDGHEALKIAEDTGYIWAKVDALELLCAYHQARAKLVQYNTAEEKESARRYKNEAAEIKKGLFLTEKQMEEIKIKARKEFEKQTAGWDEE